MSAYLELLHKGTKDKACSVHEVNILENCMLLQGLGESSDEGEEGEGEEGLPEGEVRGGYFNRGGSLTKSPGMLVFCC